MTEEINNNEQKQIFCITFFIIHLTSRLTHAIFVQKTIYANEGKLQ